MSENVAFLICFLYFIWEPHPLIWATTGFIILDSSGPGLTMLSWSGTFQLAALLQIKGWSSQIHYGTRLCFLCTLSVRFCKNLYCFLYCLFVCLWLMTPTFLNLFAPQVFSGSYGRCEATVNFSDFKNDFYYPPQRSKFNTEIRMAKIRN